MERMSLLDASFLYFENDVTPMHIGGVAVLEGPPPTHDELVSCFAPKLHLVPRYRQKVRFLPLYSFGNTSGPPTDPPER